MRGRYVIGGLVWLLAAVCAAAFGVTERMRPPLPQVILLVSTLALIAGYLRSRGFRAWLDALTLRNIAFLHLFRFVGIYFLVLYGRGELPYAFAVPGGWGDIVSASGALAVVVLAPDFSTRRPISYLWNTWGLIDILLVVVTAARQGFADPQSMHALLVLPLAVLPTFYVPLVIASHLLVFRGLALRAGRTTDRIAVARP